MTIINLIKQIVYQNRGRKSFKRDMYYLDKVKFKYVTKKEKLEKEIFIKTGKTIDELAKAGEHVPPEYLDDLLHINDILILYRKMLWYQFHHLRAQIIHAHFL